MNKSIEAEIVVIGAGPGGYTAAFRAADLGKKVILIERYDSLGGVCLNVGCIPSKALLHIAKIKGEAEHSAAHGLEFAPPKIDKDKILNWKNSIITKLTLGLKGLAKQRKVDVITGDAKFTSSKQIVVNDQIINFQHAVIAVGSRPVALPFLPKDPRVINSTGALELKDIPKKLLVIGGGIIGMEMATVYEALGSQVTVVELTAGLLAGADSDIVKPLTKRMQNKLEIILNTKVTKVDAKPDGLWATFEGAQAPNEPQRFDKVLEAVGRIPNGKDINAAAAGVKVDDRGFIPVDTQQRTNVANIFAIGDVVGNPMLAHKAIPEGRVAAEVIAGKKHFFEPRCIPSVAYTDPEVSWVGVTENEAKEQKLDYGKGVFPWMASGRALTQGREEGITKLLFDNKTNRIIGAGIVGTNAGDLIAEVALAIEMGCDAEDLALTVHPHPTLAESIALATECFEGTITDLYMPKKR